MPSAGGDVFFWLSPRHNDHASKRLVRTAGMHRSIRNDHLCIRHATDKALTPAVDVPCKDVAAA